MSRRRPATAKREPECLTSRIRWPEKRVCVLMPVSLPVALSVSLVWRDLLTVTPTLPLSTPG